MNPRSFHRLGAFFLPIFVTVLIVLFNNQPHQQPIMTSSQQLLSDPFLQLPTKNSVRVVWFTDFMGSRHTVTYGMGLNHIAQANTTKLSRMREDKASYWQNVNREGDAKIITRDIWRHEALISGLNPGKRIPYQVTSIKEDGEQITSKTFTLAPKPQPGQPLKILLTSDHQLKHMTAANLQKVVETIGQVDGVFFAGDLINVPDRASEWFDDSRGGAFFPCLQGNAQYKLENNGVVNTYTGGEIIQNAPLYPTIGNHEVMGRFSQAKSLNQQFEDAVPKEVAKKAYDSNQSLINPGEDPIVKQAWLKANSFNTDTYEEIFTLPESIPGGKKYYAVSFGDIRLVVLYVTNIWRPFQQDDNLKGRYQEKLADLDNPENWGYGQHIFEPIAKGSTQYNWLQQELNSTEFQEAKYKVVMFHHPPHTLGGNIVPAYTNPVPKVESDSSGKVTSVQYEYPLEADYIIRDLEPLLESAGVQLVYYGHSHLWNRFVSPKGMNFLESSNVGNSYGANLGEQLRPIPTGLTENYIAQGDPNGLEAIVPNVQPLEDDLDAPLPYVASNEITVFSILDTTQGTVSSYRFDTSKPDSEVIKFDEFSIAN